MSDTTHQNLSDELFIHMFEMKVTTVNDEPTTNVERSEALYAAVDAAKEALKVHGFEIARTGYGVRRIEVN